MTENNAAQAIQESERNAAVEEYFGHRAWIKPIASNFRLFEAGFDRAYALLSKLRAEGVQAGDDWPARWEAMRHEANEWADMAINGLQWVRNIQDGTSTADKALENLSSNLAHCRATQARTALASAPVAGEAHPVAWHCNEVGVTDIAHVAQGWREELGFTVRPLVFGDASPQASEAVRNAVKICGRKVIKALAAIAMADGPDTRRADDPELIYRPPVMAEVVCIRQAYDELERILKTQADKDGGNGLPPNSWEADWVEFIAWHKQHFGEFLPDEPLANARRIGWHAGAERTAARLKEKQNA